MSVHLNNRLVEYEIFVKQRKDEFKESILKMVSFKVLPLNNIDLIEDVKKYISCEAELDLIKQLKNNLSNHQLEKIKKDLVTKIKSEKNESQHLIIVSKLYFLNLYIYWLKQSQTSEK